MKPADLPLGSGARRSDGIMAVKESKMSDVNETLVRKHYPPEFKSEAVKLALQQGYTCGRAGKQLGVPKKTQSNGVLPHRKQQRSEQTAAGLKIDDPTTL